VESRHRSKDLRQVQDRARAAGWCAWDLHDAKHKQRQGYRMARRLLAWICRGPPSGSENRPDGTSNLRHRGKSVHRRVLLSRGGGAARHNPPSQDLSEDDGGPGKISLVLEEHGGVERAICRKEISMNQAALWISSAAINP